MIDSQLLADLKPYTIVYKDDIPYYFVSALDDKAILMAPDHLVTCAVSEVTLEPKCQNLMQINGFKIPKPIIPKNHDYVYRLDGSSFYYRETPESKDFALRGHYFENKNHAKAYNQAMRFIMDSVESNESK